MFSTLQEIRQKIKNRTNFNPKYVKNIFKLLSLSLLMSLIQFNQLKEVKLWTKKKIWRAGFRHETLERVANRSTACVKDHRETHLLNKLDGHAGITDLFKSATR